jgi:hypothetical protein
MTNKELKVKLVILIFLLHKILIYRFLIIIIIIIILFNFCKNFLNIFHVKSVVLNHRDSHSQHVCYC